MPENLRRNTGLSCTVAIYKDEHARIIIMRPETILHEEAGHIYADRPFA